jgi:hypothetical protein
VREETIADAFSEVLGRLSFGDEVLSCVSKALRESHADEKQEHEAAIARLQAEHERLQNRVHAMYLDKLDGRIDKHFFEKLSAEFRSEQARCIREITWHQAADQSYLEEGVRLLDLAHDARRLFAKQEPHEKRRLLNFVLSNSTWANGELAVTFRQPFDLLAQTTAIVARGNGGSGPNSPGHPGWLGFLDTYRTLCLAPSGEMRVLFQLFRQEFPAVKSS